MHTETGKPEENEQICRPAHRWQDNIQWKLKE